MRVFNNVESIFIYKTVSPYVCVCMYVTYRWSTGIYISLEAEVWYSGVIIGHGECHEH